MKFYMKLYLKLLSWVRPLWESFYSIACYRRVARQWSNLALGYLLLLVIVMSLPSYLLISDQINQFYTRTAIPLAAQFPTVTVTQGQIQIDKPLPYAIYLPQQAYPYVLFLDVDELSEEEVDALPAHVVATKRVIYSQHVPNQSPLVYPLPQETQRHMTSQQLELLLQTAKKMLLYTIFPLIVGVMFLGILLLMLLIAIISRLMALIVRADLSYSQRVRLAVVALTPPVIIGSVLYWIQVTPDYLLSLLFIMMVGYNVFAICCNRQQAPK